MNSYSIVMPAYLRTDLIRRSLQSVFNQEILPLEIIIVDNNTDENASVELNNLIESLTENKIPLIKIKSNKNSGAIARNIGSKIAKGDLIAFLDSDVILYPNYYKDILNIFDNNLEIIAAQGTDQTLIKSEKYRKRKPIYKNALYFFEDFFETSSLLNKKYPFVSPSLAISHPDVTKDFYFKTEWISTCAGVFRRNLFEKYSFPNQFVTYSNNEYLFFSYNLFLKNEGIMIYSSVPKYENIQTQEGRIPKLSLIYQIEVYDLFIFIELFPKTLKNIFIFLKSRIGHLIYNLLHALKNSNYSPIYLFKIMWASFYPFININKIIVKDLSFYERDFIYKNQKRI